MAIDAYSLCPGGTGKKIKFCCGDFLPELQKIDRMFEGEQYLACLKHVDRLLAQEPGAIGRACWPPSACCCGRRTSTRPPEPPRRPSWQNIRTTRLPWPNRPFSAAETDPLAALDWSAAGDARRRRQPHGTHLSGDGHDGGGPASRGFSAAGPRLAANAGRLASRTTIGRRNCCRRLVRRPTSRFCCATIRRLLPCPEDVPWKDRFDEALQAIGRGDWQTAADRLTALAADVPDSPAVWRNLATLRGWLADNAGCTDALRQVRGDAGRRGRRAGGRRRGRGQAMFFADDPLGDRLEMFKLVWTVKDVERSQEAFLSSPRLQADSLRSGAVQRRRESAAEGRLHAVGSAHAGIGRRAEPGDDAATCWARRSCSAGRPTARPGWK